MSWAAVHSAIRTRFETEWAGRTPAQMPKVKFDKPEDSAWVRLAIQPASSNWASMGDPGNNVERNRGQVTLQIFTPSGEGEGEMLELIENARAVYHSWCDTVSGVRFEVPSYPVDVGVSGKWYQVNVIAPFRFDDHA